MGHPIHLPLCPPRAARPPIHGGRLVRHERSVKEPWATFVLVIGAPAVVAAILGLLVLAVIGALYVLGVAA